MYWSSTTPLPHVPDVMIFDLYMLRPVMEYRVLGKLHTTLISQCIKVGSNSRSNILASNFQSHTASRLATLAAIYSVFDVLSATDVFFFLNH
jgi:hypothetical protein